MEDGSYLVDLILSGKEDQDIFSGNESVKTGKLSLHPSSQEYQAKVEFASGTEGSNEPVIRYVEIDLPIAVVDYLNETYNTNIKIKFVEINWVLKETELSSKAIDCVWNGMTITDERLEAMTVSMPYLINKQCVLIRKADADKYKTLEDLKNARVVAEQGSAGETIAEGLFKTSDEDEE